MVYSYEWSADKQKKWAEQHLIKYIKNYVYPYHPYYRKKFNELGINPQKIKDYSDILKLPLTTKEILTQDHIAFILQPKFPGKEARYDTAPISKKHLLRHIYNGLFKIPKYPGTPKKVRKLRYRIEAAAKREWLPIHFHASGGTTGNPSPAVYTWFDIRENVSPQTAMFTLTGIEQEHRGLNLFPAAPHLAFFQVVFSAFLAGGSIFHTCGGSVIPTERQIQIADQVKFDFVIAIPSYLTHWLDVAGKMLKEGKIKGLDTMRLAVVAAEPMVPAYRERLKNQFAEVGAKNVKIIEGYGMTEVRGGFYECDEGTGIHLNNERFFWEVLDPETKQPVPEGKPGILTFSHVGWRGTVVLRYYTGDLITGLIWDKCEHCGLTLPRLLTPMCRSVKDFTKIKGSRVPLLNLQTAVRNSFGVESFHILITKENPDDPFSRDWVKVYVAKKESSKDEDVSAAIKKNVKLDCEISPSEIIFESSEMIEKRLFSRTGLKADWVVDERQVKV